MVFNEYHTSVIILKPQEGIMAEHVSTKKSKSERCPECGAPIIEEYGGESGKSIVAYRCANPKCSFYHHYGD